MYLQGLPGRSNQTAVPCSAAVTPVASHCRTPQPTVEPHVQISGEVEWQQPRLGRGLNLPVSPDCGQHQPPLMLVRSVESVPNQNS